jgi:hypothetical protein
MTGLQEENSGLHRRGDVGKDRKQEAWPVDEKKIIEGEKLYGYVECYVGLFRGNA